MLLESRASVLAGGASGPGHHGGDQRLDPLLGQME